jgi:hypothetical protein
MNILKKQAQSPVREPGEGLQDIFGWDRRLRGVEGRFMAQEDEGIRKLGDFPLFIFGRGEISLASFWETLYPRWYE